MMILSMVWAAEPGLEASDRLVSVPTGVHDTWSGELAMEGHDREPGAVRTYEAVLQLEASADGVRVREQQGDWVHNVWVPTRGAALERTDGDWSAADDWTVVMALAPRPDLLAAWLARDVGALYLVDDRVLWAADEGLVEVSMADGRLSELRLRRDHPVFGDVDDTVRWSEEALEVHRAQADTRFRLSLRPGPSPELPLAALPEREGAATSQVAPGLWTLELPEAEIRSYVVVEGREGLILDAPLSDAIGERLLLAAMSVAPEVETWGVVVSHHHPHYTGGLRPFVRRGMAVYVPEGIVEWLSGTLAEPRRRARDEGLPHAELVPVKKTTRLLGGAVRLHRLGEASGHTDAFVVAEHVPTHSLYVADLGGCPTDRSPWSRGAWLELAGERGVTQVLSAFPLEGHAATCDVTGFEMP